jgi:hypothetical protein
LKRPDHALGPNKKIQLINKNPAPTAKPLKTNVFEDDVRARRERRFEREALIEQNRPITRYQNGMVSGGSLAARMQGFTHQNMPLGYVPEPVPDAVRLCFASVARFLVLYRMSLIGISTPSLENHQPSSRTISA